LLFQFIPFIRYVTMRLARTLSYDAVLDNHITICALAV
jgi:hypothetical protein